MDSCSSTTATAPPSCGWRPPTQSSEKSNDFVKQSPGHDTRALLANATAVAKRQLVTIELRRRIQERWYPFPEIFQALSTTRQRGALTNPDGWAMLCGPRGPRCQIIQKSIRRKSGKPCACCSRGLVKR